MTEEKTALDGTKYYSSVTPLGLRENSKLNRTPKPPKSKKTTNNDDVVIVKSPKYLIMEAAAEERGKTPDTVTIKRKNNGIPLLGSYHG